MFKIRKLSKGFKNFEGFIETSKTVFFVYNAKAHSIKRGVEHKRYNPFIKKYTFHLYI